MARPCTKRAVCEMEDRQTPSPQMIRTALKHIEKRGSLQGVPALRQEKLALMKAAIDVLRRSVTRLPLACDAVQEGGQPSRLFAVEEWLQCATTVCTRLHPDLQRSKTGS